MKNIFERRFKKNDNPFINDKADKGDITMDEQITEEITEEAKNETSGEEVNVKDDEIKDAEENLQQEGIEVKSEENSEYEKIKEDFNNLNNQYLRLAADFDNYRKRQAQEREALIKYGAEECMKKIIEVADNFDRALTMVEKIEDLEKMKETFFVLNKQLSDSLTKLGLEQIKCVGEKFNPMLHEAVMQTPTEEYEEDTVITEMQKGYKYGEKVIRPAMVSVAVKQ